MHLRVDGANSNFLLNQQRQTFNAREIKKQGKEWRKTRAEIDGKQFVIYPRLSGRLDRHSSHLEAGSLQRWHQAKAQQSFRLVCLLLFLLLLDRMWARAATAPTGKTALPVWMKWLQLPNPFALCWISCSMSHLLTWHPKPHLLHQNTSRCIQQPFVKQLSQQLGHVCIPTLHQN